MMPPADSTPPPATKHWRTVVDFDGMTWGDLRAMLRLAGHLPDDEPVEFDWVDDYSEVSFATGIIIRGRDA